MKIFNDEFKDRARKTVGDMITSISTILKETAMLAIQKTKNAFEQAKRDKQQYLSQQAQLAQQTWVQSYTQTTTPALANIVANALNAVTHTTISPLAVSCSFMYQTTSNIYVWNVDVAVGTTVNISNLNATILTRHLNNALKNINTNAIANFNAFFTNSWNSDGATPNGKVARHSYYSRHWLELWQITVVNLTLNAGVIQMTLSLQETPHVAYFANLI